MSNVNDMNIMLDLETLGTTPGSVILSIGATSFYTKDDRKPAEFYEKISIEDSKSCGLTVDTATLSWWNKQPLEIYQEAASGDDKLLEVLVSFREYLELCKEYHHLSTVCVWGNGADFDNVLLRCAYDAVGLPLPWNYYNNRCFRTLKNLPGVPAAPQFRGVKHNALADAKHQAVHAEKILDYIILGS